MRRILGRSGLEVSALGMGCWAIGGPWRFMGKPSGWGIVDDAESVHAIQVALDSGINFFDTAANYGTGHSERIVGQSLAGKRHQAVIATKFGFRVDEKTKNVSRFASPEEVVMNVRAACEASLKRLGTEYIDLYQLHVWDFPTETALALRDELEGLVRDGKIRFYGWSTDLPERVLIFAQGDHCTAVQHDLNVIMDASEMLSLCEQHNLASVNRSPLARGALSGKYTMNTVFADNDVRIDPWSVEHFFTPTLDKIDALRSVLTSGGRTLAQGALAWIWARSSRAIPIPGCRNVQQVVENARAMQFGPLTSAQMTEIEAIMGRACPPAS